jgi:hypothetical protein
MAMVFTYCEMFNDFLTRLKDGEIDLRQRNLGMRRVKGIYMYLKSRCVFVKSM